MGEWGEQVDCLLELVSWRLCSVQLAKKHHPDRKKGDPEAAKQFTTIGEAYEVSTVLYLH